MFRHIFYYRLLSGLRDRQTVFWTFIFPIILATLFSFAFSDLNANESFQSIPIAIVDNNYWEEDQMFQEVIKQVSTGDNHLFDYQILPREKADKMLQDNLLTGYIIPGETLQVVIKYSGLRQSIIKVFADEYMQTRATISRLIRENPQIDINSLMPTVASYVEDKPISSAAPDNTLSYYYALIAMACLYGGFWGQREVMAVKANMTAQGARVCVSPVSKLRQFSYAISVAFLIHFASVLLLLAFLTQILGVDFGERTGYLLLASLIGSSLGVNIGALIAAAGNQSEGVKTSILIAFSMVMSFFSGLMVVDMKYIITEALPPMRWLNPANLISDAYYSLYYFDTTQRFWQNIIAMLAMHLLIGTAIVIIMRRQRYASV